MFTKQRQFLSAGVPPSLPKICYLDLSDIFGPRIKDVLVRFHIGARNLTVMPGDQDLCSMEWGMNIVKLRKCTRAEMARNPPWSTSVKYDEQAGFGRFWRSFGAVRLKSSASER